MLGGSKSPSDCGIMSHLQKFPSLHHAVTTELQFLFSKLSQMLEYSGVYHELALAMSVDVQFSARTL